MSIRIIIGSASEKITRQLSQFLTESGYSVIGEVGSGHEFLRKVHTMYPDLSIVDYKLKGMNGHELSEILVCEKICPVIALLKNTEVGHFINVSQEPNFVPLVKPFSRQILTNTIDLLVKTSRTINSLEKEIQNIYSVNDKNIIINKAKKLLIENMNLTEEEAHRRIQKHSMDKSITKIKVAEAIIRIYEKDD